MRKHSMAVLSLATALALGCAGLAGCESTSAKENQAETVTCTSDYIDASYDDTTHWIGHTIYDVDEQAAIAEDLESQKDGQTLAQPLVVYNPFGTNSQSLYVYFTTEEAASVSYTVSISEEAFATIDDETLASDSIADFTREVDDGESGTEFEFSLYGLVPNVENTVTITATYESGDIETTTFACEMCDVLGDEELQLDIADGDSDAELTDGLYAILGNTNLDDVNFTYFYDNDGILRGELPLYSYRSQRLVFQNGLMYFSYSYNNIAAMNELGQVVATYALNDDADGPHYNQHHDYVFDESDHLMILCSESGASTKEDLIVFLNVETGKIDYVLDMGDLLATYKEEAIEYNLANDEEADEDGHSVDWIHINTIQWVGDDSILLSCREISSIIKVSDVYGEPYIDYIISSEEYWEGTEYEDLVYEQVGDFTVQGGQHTVTYIEDDSLEEGQYYLSMFNNNMGKSAYTTSDFDYSSIGLTNTSETSDEEGVYSYYYKYLVDENEGTFELVDSFEVPYSGFYSSTQEIGSNFVVDSGALGWFGEYDEDGTLIRSFEMDFDSLVYRVFKYDL